MKRIIIIFIVAFTVLISLDKIKQALSNEKITGEMELIYSVEDNIYELEGNPITNATTMLEDFTNRWSRTTNKMSSFVLNIEQSASTWLKSIEDDFTKVDWTNWGQNTSEQKIKFNGLISYLFGIIKTLTTPITFAILGISGIVGAMIILISFFF